MGQQFYNFLVVMVNYKPLILIALLLILVVILIILGQQMALRLKVLLEEKRNPFTKDMLSDIDGNAVAREQKHNVLRTICAPDGLDPNPKQFLEIEDGGILMYQCCFTIDKMPKRTTFANTFAELFNFPDCTSSVFVEPIDEREMGRKLDHQITVLQSEYMNAAGDPNRQRKLRGQYQEADSWAVEVESGDNKFFNVGFLFELSAETPELLTKKCTDFHTLAATRGVDVISCYGVQAEAHLTNSPFNFRYKSTTDKLGAGCGVKMAMFDKQSVATIFNYTQCDFSHKDGIPLGRNLITHRPVVFDIYDRGHDGFTILIVGKTGTGKSATIKIMASRYRLLGYKFVCVDSQVLKGTDGGEYSATADALGGNNFKISSASDNILNFFDIGETKKFRKQSIDSGVEIRTLELNDKVTQVCNILFGMVQGDKEEIPFELHTFIEEILTDNVNKVYQQHGIFDGNADSIYEKGKVVVEGRLTSGKVRKQMPTISELYQLLLIANRDNRDEERIKPYKVILAALKTYVKELYYSENTVHFFTKQEYEALPVKPGTHIHIWKNPSGREEECVAVRGVRPYYDGQSTFTISKDCPFTNIDLSQLTENEKLLARQIAIEFVNENFIKKNSESLKAADKLVAIFDEAHEEFANTYARATIDNVVRTARKRNVAVILSTQALREYDTYNETKSIFKNAAVKIILKQDPTDRDWLKESLKITDGQVDKILELGGNMDSTGESSGGNKHRGEACIIDGKQVCFVKVDYLKECEKYAVETDANEIDKMFKVTQKINNPGQSA